MISLICYSVISYLLLSSVGSAQNPRWPDECPSYSCGAIGNIRYPFYINDSQSSCGHPVYELFCNGTNTLIDLQSDKYYVDEISYADSTIKITSINPSHGNCALPPQSLTYFELQGFAYGSDFWVSFINCSKRIQKDAYLPITCLTQNGSFVYAVSNGEAYEVQYLEPSCSFQAMFPLSNSAAPSTEQDLFQLLQSGYTLQFSTDLSYTTPFSQCWREASRKFKDQINSGKILSIISSPFYTGKTFSECMDDFTKNKLLIVLLRALKVFVGIASILIVLSLLGKFVFAPTIIFVFIAYKLHRMRAIVDTVEEFLQSQQTLAPRRYAYTDLIAMTRHFREKLGQGGFGSVFKGQRPGGCSIAVKMLSNAKGDGEEFINEVSTIGRIHHVNVVQLVGFCSEGSKRALVYEYMPNGSLDKYIFSSNGKNRPLTDDKLIEIALGIARGIDYLHRGCDVRILHFDIKPHNILLDHNMNPKVSDFGLAKFYPKEYSFVSFSAARGTVGYIAPEVISRNFGVISYKSDVYSFGMLLMEMAGGRRNSDPRSDNSSQEYYPSIIYDRLSQEEESQFDDKIMVGELERKLCKVGLWCIQMRPSDRPSMSEVVEMLEGDMENLKMPPKPFLSSAQPRVVRQSFLNFSPSELDKISEDE